MTSVVLRCICPWGSFPNVPALSLCDPVAKLPRGRRDRDPTDKADIRWIHQRLTEMSRALVRPLPEHLCRAHAIHQQDLVGDYGRVGLPHARGRGSEDAKRESRWPFVFPQEHRWANPRFGEHRTTPGSRITRIWRPIRLFEWLKRKNRDTTHAHRHSSPVYMLADGHDPGTPARRQGHQDIGVRMIPAHVSSPGRRTLPSPADRWAGGTGER